MKGTKTECIWIVIANHRRSGVECDSFLSGTVYTVTPEMEVLFFKCNSLPNTENYVTLIDTNL